MKLHIEDLMVPVLPDASEAVLAAAAGEDLAGGCVPPASVPQCPVDTCTGQGTVQCPPATGFVPFGAVQRRARAGGDAKEVAFGLVDHRHELRRRMEEMGL